MRGTAGLLAAALLAAGCAAPRPPGGLPNEGVAPASVDPGENAWNESPSGPSRDEPTPKWVLENEVHATWIPYAWSAKSGGDQSGSGLRLPFDGSDETAGGLRAEAYLDRVAWGVDTFLVSAGGEEGSVKGDLDYFTLRFAAHMRVAGPDPRSRDEGGMLSVLPTLDGIVGVRMHYANGTLRDSSAFSDAGDSEWWAEPVAGVRASATVLRRLTLFGRAEGGGIDVGSWSSWSYDLEAGAQLAITGNLGLVAAWRWYGADYRGDPDVPGSPELDLRLGGPWVGLVLEF